MEREASRAIGVSMIRQDDDRQDGVLARFLWREDGLSTMDWVVIASAATGLGMIVLSFSHDTLDDHSADIRAELQDGSFSAPWVADLPVQQP
jgi:hypothetical protein